MRRHRNIFHKEICFNSRLTKLRDMNYKDYIEIRPDKRFGKPCLKGTRISVYDVLNWLANGMTKAEIMEDFEEISEEMISACLAFAADKDHALIVSS